MKKILSMGIFAASLALGISHSNAQGMTEEELSMQRIQDRLSSIEKNMSTMQQDVYKNNKKIKNKQQPSEEPIGAEDEKNRALNGKIEEVEHSVNTLATKLDKIIADIDFRLTAIEKNVSAQQNAATAATAATDAKPVDTANQNKAADVAEAPTKNEEDTAPIAAHATLPASNESSTNATVASPATANTPAAKTTAKKPSNVTKTDAATQYDKAFEFMRLAKYEEAEKAFKDFIANNKGNDLLGNAYYWLGETYFARENYQQAAVNFLKGYQDYPKGNKAPDNLLKLAMSLKNMKKEKEACATIDKMKKEYPKMDKDLLAKANSEYKGLKCK